MKSRKLSYKIYIALCGVTIISAVFSLANLIAIPQFRTAVYLTSLLLILFRLLHNKDMGVKRIISALALMACVSFIFFISVLTDPREGRFESVSPARANTIIVEYDYASRPALYRKTHGIFMKRIPFGFGPGYNETIRHEVVWLSESQFKLTDYLGGEWLVDLE